MTLIVHDRGIVHDICMILLIVHHTCLPFIPEPVDLITQLLLECTFSNTLAARPVDQALSSCTCNCMHVHTLLKKIVSVRTFGLFVW